ncbi:hypothetical protein DCAR_0313708 [Daucus carota subsp. sativus]|uniref:Dipeptidylpeptidase IV N-terminal domain-containing protein n=1 Tax=Daucus carota subsp. sativus TaxID=79200 RepID=A0AAF0WTW8_DAUCS|nr:hypothetical protein DCAR_0313708 [Daucus carota subsp. sativus]
MGEERGSIAFFTTYRPPVALDIFCTSFPQFKNEVKMTDEVSYNYNGHSIPPAALKTLLKRPLFVHHGINEADVDSGRVSGTIFVSERESLETFHVALDFKDGKRPRVFSLADVYGRADGVRMEDSACIAGQDGEYLVFVSTKEPAKRRRQPWTVVYKMNLVTGRTERLTPSLQADLSPSVSPCGKKIAVASFQKKAGWNGEIQDLQTDIFVMNIEKPYKRHLVVDNGGWPTWGSDNIIFFHRKAAGFWGVFRADIGNGLTQKCHRVTPDNVDAMTPVAIDATTVAVAINRPYSSFSIEIPHEKEIYRHIEIHDSTKTKAPVLLTQYYRPTIDHFNPFVIIDGAKKHIGYHRCIQEHNMEKRFHKVLSPQPDVGLFRLSGAFPTFSKDGSKLAYVGNDFKAVWIVDFEGTGEPREVPDNLDTIFAPIWNQNPKKDILYVCMGSSFNDQGALHIYHIANVSKERRHHMQLTTSGNNAFPSTNPEGTKLVYRSTRDCKNNEGYKNLYIMEDLALGDSVEENITRLTEGNWVDTHCQWSPSGNWIVFSSSRHKSPTAAKKDHMLDAGYFAIYLVDPKHKDVVVRVLGSADDLAGHVNHPFFSPDGKSIVITADLAAVSVDPISLPLIEHSARPYGDIFSVDIDPNDIKKNENVKKFNRLTHTRYENSTGTWTTFSTHDTNAVWNRLIEGDRAWGMSGHPCLPKRCP